MTTIYIAKVSEDEIIKNPGIYIHCDQTYEISQKLVESNVCNLKYVLNPTNKLIRKTMKMCNKYNIKIIYELIKNPDEAMNILAIQKYKKDDIIELYSSIINKTEKICFYVIKYCDIKYISCLYQLFENQSENIAICAIERYYKNINNGHYNYFDDYSAEYDVHSFYELIVCPTDQIKFKIIQMFEWINKLEHIYDSIENKTDEIKIFICTSIKFSHNITFFVKVYNSIVNPSDDIKCKCAVNINDITEKIKIYNSINNPTNEMKISIIKNMLMLFELCDTNRKIIYEHIISTYQSMTELNNEEEDIIKKLYNYNKKNMYTTYLEFILSRKYISEKIYIENYNSFGGSYLYKIQNPSEKFLIKIVEKHWSNLRYIKKKYQTNNICNAAIKQSYLANLFVNRKYNKIYNCNNCEYEEDNILLNNVSDRELYEKKDQ
jgi:hypothetical protein